MGETSFLHTKSTKHLENKLHEELYNNLLLLNALYPPTNEYLKVFKEDMFVKSNKTAFFEVSYYLLKTLNPEVIKSKVPTWPIFEIPHEKAYRTEVMKYINELDTLYECADVPTVLYSNIIAPGGNKFVKVMFKLSQLVLVEHLKKMGESELLYPSKRKGKHRDLGIKTLQNTSQAIKTKTRTSLESFKTRESEMKEEAERLIKEQSDMNENNKTIKEKYKEALVTFEENNKNFPPDNVIVQRFERIQEQLQKLKNLSELVEDCNGLISHLETGANLLRFDKNKHKFKGNESINLLDFMQAVNTAIKTHSLELPVFTETEISEYSQSLSLLEQKYNGLDSDLNNCNKDLKKSLEDARIYIKTIITAEMCDKTHKEDVENEVTVNVN